MIAVFLFFILLAVIFGALGAWGTHVNHDDMWKGEVRMWGGWIMCAINILLAIFAIFSCIRWQTGTDVQTGYIYAVEEEFGRGTVHLRMSLEAGKDSQKPFCVDGENLEKARALAGTGKKVRVTIPATGIHIESNYFACTTKVVIEEVESK